MTELWTYRAFEDANEADRFDLTGWDVHATDGSIGKVDEATYEAGHSYIVVDTGFWIFGKKRMIPAGSIDRLDQTTKTVYVGMTKDQVKQAPDYDEVGGDDEYMERHTDYYGTAVRPRSTSQTKRSQN